MRDWIDATAKEIGRWLNLDADVIEEISERIRRHVPPQPGEEPQAVQKCQGSISVKWHGEGWEAKCLRCGATGYGHTADQAEDAIAIHAPPQPSPSPVDVEKIEQHLTDFHNGRISGALVAGDAAALLAEVRELRSEKDRLNRELDLKHVRFGNTEELEQQLAAAQAREKRLREACEHVVGLYAVPPDGHVSLIADYPDKRAWRVAAETCRAALQQPSDGNLQEKP